MEQMTIFDFLEPEPTDFHQMTEEEMVEYIGNQLGLKFKHNDFLNQWECYVTKKIKFELEYSTYWTNEKNNGQRFISAGFQLTTGSYLGGRRPCDSLEEALDFFKYQLGRIKRGEIR